MNANQPIPTFDEFKQSWLEDVQAPDSDGKKPPTVELGHRFAHKLVTQWLEVGKDDVSDDLIYCDGSGDGGIDIAYLHRGAGRTSDSDNESSSEGDIWYLVQSKYGKAFQGVSTLLEEGHKVIETLDGHTKRLSSISGSLLERLNNFRRKAATSELDRIILMFATTDPLSEEQRRALGEIQAAGRDRLGPIFDVQAVSLATIYQRLDDTPNSLIALRVPIRAELAASGSDLLVGSVLLPSLYAFLQNYKAETGDLDQLYEKNVRRFLGSRGRVNKAIQETLKRTPEAFGLYNNGITIVVEDFHSNDDGTIELVEPYIVNGCQTTRTIWEVFHQKLESGGSGVDPELEDWERKAGQGVVVTKVVKVGDVGEILLQDITRYTNNQNAVSEKDFLTLNKDLRSIARQMGEKYNVFLEVQRGGWDSQQAYQNQHPGTTRFSDHSNAFDLIKVYGAGWLREAGTAFGRNAAFLPNGSVYKAIFPDTIDENDEPFDVDDFYAAYRLQQAAEEFSFGRAANQPSRRQTRFLFYMVVLELLKDVMVRSGINLKPRPKDLTRALLELFTSSNQAAIKELLNTAINVIDEYLTPGKDDSVFVEPEFIRTFNNDLNGYLKAEKLGKSEDFSPRFRSLLNDYERTMGRATGGQQSPRELLTSVIKEQIDV